MPSSREVIDTVRREVALRFSIKDIFAAKGGLGFILDDTRDLEAGYEELRAALRPMGMIVSLVRGEDGPVILVMNIPSVKGRPVSINQLMLLITIATTVISGSVLWTSFSGGYNILSLENLIWGALTFAFPLLLILGTHEFSHYLMSRRYGLSVSLPFFIPSFPPVGTFGAFISIREPLPSRKALVDIGLAGPIGGFLVAIPVLIIGYGLSTTDTTSLIQEGVFSYFGMPLLLQLIMTLSPPGGDLFMHPTMFAGWLGLFITGINLLPAGQLDGGHVSRAVLGDKASWLGYLVMLLLFLLSALYTGWLIFGILILVLGVAHPPPLNDVTPLDSKRYVAAFIGMVLLLTCFVPIPMEVYENDNGVDVLNLSSASLDASAGDVVSWSFTMTNEDYTNASVTVGVEDLPSGWNYTLTCPDLSTSSIDDSLSLTLGDTQAVTVYLNVTVPASASAGTEEFYLTVLADDVQERVSLQVTIS